jgi:hypothetical protein
MVKVIVILLVIAVLMEDGSSMRKTDQERKEDEEVAKSVNATLAAEEAEKKKEEDERKKREEKKKTADMKDKKDVEPKERSNGKDEASPCYNLTCPDIEPCQPCNDCEVCKDCPPEKKCGSCPPVEPCMPCEECPVCKECGPCPRVKPCQPCSGTNETTIHLDCPSPQSCEELTSMSVPEAIAVGAVAGFLVTGVATAVGLLLRYASPIVSGFVFLASLILIWYLSSHHPETARELGGRAATLLREAAVALGHRVMAAIQRHQEQVGFPVLFNFLL